jgi:N-acetylglutamate synthase-like GNAT family acetyltransferase
MRDIYNSYNLGAPDRTCNFWVAEIDGEIVGCVAAKAVEDDPTCIELQRMSVAKKAQRKGVGG